MGLRRHGVVFPETTSKYIVKCGYFYGHKDILEEMLKLPCHTVVWQGMKNQVYEVHTWHEKSKFFIIYKFEKMSEVKYVIERIVV
jgi:hypothetical protein